MRIEVKMEVFRAYEDSAMRYLDQALACEKAGRLDDAARMRGYAENEFQKADAVAQIEVGPDEGPMMIVEIR